MPTKILCLDIETCPDTDLVPADWPQDKFLKVLWHRVVTISYAVARIETDPATRLERYEVELCRSGGEPGWDERRLLAAFWRFFSAGYYRLVTWNGRSFDAQVLLTRAFLYGIPAAAWFTRGDRWTGYGSRFSQDYHADLLELLSAHGAATRIGLDEMATAMGVPGKNGEHGSKVHDLVAQGKIESVRNYCECDVLNTLALYFRWALLCGRSTVEGHDASMLSLQDYLQSHRRDRPHLGTFLDCWRRSDRPTPMLAMREK